MWLHLQKLKLHCPASCFLLPTTKICTLAVASVLVISSAFVVIALTPSVSLSLSSLSKSFAFLGWTSSSSMITSNIAADSSSSHSYTWGELDQRQRLERSEMILARARRSIKAAAADHEKKCNNNNNNNNNNNVTTLWNKSDQEHNVPAGDDEYTPQGPLYRNACAFLRSYEEMEKVFKMYVYEEGDFPIFHNGPGRSIYSSEGNFILEMERWPGRLSYRTWDPREAHVFFLPFSVVVMVQYLYEPGSRDRAAITQVVADYVRTVSLRHPFWNVSLGADHVILSCHDWGPYSTKSVPHLFHNSIRVFCNANTSEGFNPLKDVSLPEVNLKTGRETGGGGGGPVGRSILAFFAGGLHGHIRHILLKHWKHKKDNDVQVYETLPEHVSYESMLKSSKFCLCPSGYEVASPRIVEAIYAGCIPVLISNGYVPPFKDVLNWEEFSLAISMEDIPNIKKILLGISNDKYTRMHKSVMQVQRHFVMNEPPIRFDLFHMILHSIWLRRLNMRISLPPSP